MPDFVPLAERIVDAILETDPGLASYAGDHRFDDRLPDLSPGAVADRVTMLRDAADALAGTEPDESDVSAQVDHAILTALVERGLFELTDVREHEWNPLDHNPGPLLHALLSRPFAPAAERLTSLGGGSPRYRTRWRRRGPCSRRAADPRRDRDRAVRRRGRADPGRAARAAGAGTGPAVGGGAGRRGRRRGPRRVRHMAAQGGGRRRAGA
jgi:hypothetical protein